MSSSSFSSTPELSPAVGLPAEANSFETDLVPKTGLVSAANPALEAEYTPEAGPTSANPVSVPELPAKREEVPGAVVCNVTATWEEYLNGTYKTATIARQITLARSLNAAGVALDFRSTAPEFTKQDDVEPLEELVQKLAVIYGRIVVQASPTGQWLDLLNHESLLQTWEQLSTELLESAADEDVTTPFFVEAINKQLTDKANVLSSLQYDYLYAALGRGCFAAALDPQAQGRVPAREFPHFFPHLPLYFTEKMTAAPADVAENVRLIFEGVLDRYQTDVPAVAKAIAQALHIEKGVDEPPMPAAPRAGTVEKPHFGYTAVHELARLTGLPVSIDLSVYARLGETYNKQYTLILSRP